MSFAADISRFVERAGGNMDTAVRQATVMLAQGVILKSPVDTGRFRANWTFAAGAVPGGTSAALDQDGRTTLSRLVAQIGVSPVGGLTYLANNLPYAVRLENGYSDQAPQGMVRLTAMEFQDYVSRAAREVNR